MDCQAPSRAHALRTAGIDDGVPRYQRPRVAVLILGDGYISWSQGPSLVYNGNAVAWYAGAVSNCGATATCTINMSGFPHNLQALTWDGRSTTHRVIIVATCIRRCRNNPVLSLPILCNSQHICELVIEEVDVDDKWSHLKYGAARVPLLSPRSPPPFTTLATVALAACLQVRQQHVYSTRTNTYGSPKRASRQRQAWGVSY